MLRAILGNASVVSRLSQTTKQILTKNSFSTSPSLQRPVTQLQQPHHHPSVVSDVTTPSVPPRPDPVPLSHTAPSRATGRGGIQQDNPTGSDVPTPRLAQSRAFRRTQRTHQANGKGKRKGQEEAASVDASKAQRPPFKVTIPPSKTPHPIYKPQPLRPDKVPIHPFKLSPPPPLESELLPRPGVLSGISPKLFKVGRIVLKILQLPLIPISVFLFLKGLYWIYKKTIDNYYNTNLDSRLTFWQANYIKLRQAIDLYSSQYYLWRTFGFESTKQLNVSQKTWNMVWNTLPIFSLDPITTFHVPTGLSEEDEDAFSLLTQDKFAFSQADKRLTYFDFIPIHDGVTMPFTYHFTKIFPETTQEMITLKTMTMRQNFYNTFFYSNGSPKLDFDTLEFHDDPNYAPYRTIQLGGRLAKDLIKDVWIGKDALYAGFSWYLSRNRSAAKEFVSSKHLALQELIGHYGGSFYRDVLRSEPSAGVDLYYLEHEKHDVESQLSAYYHSIFGENLPRINLHNMPINPSNVDRSSLAPPHQHPVNLNALDDSTYYFSEGGRTVPSYPSIIQDYAENITTVFDFLREAAPPFVHSIFNGRHPWEQHRKALEKTKKKRFWEHESVYDGEAKMIAEQFLAKFDEHGRTSIDEVMELVNPMLSNQRMIRHRLIYEKLYSRSLLEYLAVLREKHPNLSPDDEENAIDYFKTQFLDYLVESGDPNPYDPLHPLVDPSIAVIAGNEGRQLNLGDVIYNSVATTFDYSDYDDLLPEHRKMIDAYSVYTQPDAISNHRVNLTDPAAARSVADAINDPRHPLDIAAHQSYRSSLINWNAIDPDVTEFYFTNYPEHIAHFLILSYQEAQNLHIDLSTAFKLRQVQQYLRHIGEQKLPPASRELFRQGKLRKLAVHSDPDQLQAVTMDPTDPINSRYDPFVVPQIRPGHLRPQRRTVAFLPPPSPGEMSSSSSHPHPSIPPEGTSNIEYLQGQLYYDELLNEELPPDDMKRLTEQLKLHPIVKTDDPFVEDTYHFADDVAGFWPSFHDNPELYAADTLENYLRLVFDRLRQASLPQQAFEKAVQDFADNPEYQRQVDFLHYSVYSGPPGVDDDEDDDMTEDFISTDQPEDTIATAYGNIPLPEHLRVRRTHDSEYDNVDDHDVDGYYADDHYADDHYADGYYADDYYADDHYVDDHYVDDETHYNASGLVLPFGGSSKSQFSDDSENAAVSAHYQDAFDSNDDEYVDINDYHDEDDEEHDLFQAYDWFEDEDDLIEELEEIADESEIIFDEYGEAMLADDDDDDDDEDDDYYDVSRLFSSIDGSLIPPTEEDLGLLISADINGYLEEYFDEDSYKKFRDYMGQDYAPENYRVPPEIAAAAHHAFEEFSKTPAGRVLVPQNTPYLEIDAMLADAGDIVPPSFYFWHNHPIVYSDVPDYEPGGIWGEDQPTDDDEEDLDGEYMSIEKALDYSLEDDYDYFDKEIGYVPDEDEDGFYYDDDEDEFYDEDDCYDDDDDDYDSEYIYEGPDDEDDEDFDDDDDDDELSQLNDAEVQNILFDVSQDNDLLDLGPHFMVNNDPLDEHPLTVDEQLIFEAAETAFGHEASTGIPFIASEDEMAYIADEIDSYENAYWHDRGEYDEGIMPSLDLLSWASFAKNGFYDNIYEWIFPYGVDIPADDVFDGEIGFFDDAEDTFEDFKTYFDAMMEIDWYDNIHVWEYYEDEEIPAEVDELKQLAKTFLGSHDYHLQKPVDYRALKYKPAVPYKDLTPDGDPIYYSPEEYDPQTWKPHLDVLSPIEYLKRTSSLPFYDRLQQQAVHLSRRIGLGDAPFTPSKRETEMDQRLRSIAGSVLPQLPLHTYKRRIANKKLNRFDRIGEQLLGDIFDPNTATIDLTKTTNPWARKVIIDFLVNAPYETRKRHYKTLEQYGVRPIYIDPQYFHPETHQLEWLPTENQELDSYFQYGDDIMARYYIENAFLPDYGPKPAALYEHPDYTPYKDPTSTITQRIMYTLQHQVPKLITKFMEDPSASTVSATQAQDAAESMKQQLSLPTPVIETQYQEGSYQHRLATHKRVREDMYTDLKNRYWSQTMSFYNHVQEVTQSEGVELTAEQRNNLLFGSMHDFMTDRKNLMGAYQRHRQNSPYFDPYKTAFHDWRSLYKYLDLIPLDPDETREEFLSKVQGKAYPQLYQHGNRVYYYYDPDPDGKLATLQGHRLLPQVTFPFKVNLPYSNLLFHYYDYLNRKTGHYYEYLLQKYLLLVLEGSSIKHPLLGGSPRLLTDEYPLFVAMPRKSAWGFDTWYDNYQHYIRKIPFNLFEDMFSTMFSLVRSEYVRYDTPEELTTGLQHQNISDFRFYENLEQDINKIEGIDNAYDAANYVFIKGIQNLMQHGYYRDALEMDRIARRINQRRQAKRDYQHYLYNYKFDRNEFGEPVLLDKHGNPWNGDLDLLDQAADPVLPQPYRLSRPKEASNPNDSLSDIGGNGVYGTTYVDNRDAINPNSSTSMEFGRNPAYDRFHSMVSYKFQEIMDGEYTPFNAIQRVSPAERAKQLVHAIDAPFNAASSGLDVMAPIPTDTVIEPPADDISAAYQDLAEYMAIPDTPGSVLPFWTMYEPDRSLIGNAMVFDTNRNVYDDFTPASNAFLYVFDGFNDYDEYLNYLNQRYPNDPVQQEVIPPNQFMVDEMFDPDALDEDEWDDGDPYGIHHLIDLRNARPEALRAYRHTSPEPFVIEDYNSENLMPPDEDEFGNYYYYDDGDEDYMNDMGINRYGEPVDIVFQPDDFDDDEFIDDDDDEYDDYVDPDALNDLYDDLSDDDDGDHDDPYDDDDDYDDEDDDEDVFNLYFEPSLDETGRPGSRRQPSSPSSTADLIEEASSLLQVLDIIAEELESVTPDLMSIQSDMYDLYRNIDDMQRGPINLRDHYFVGAVLQGTMDTDHPHYNLHRHLANKAGIDFDDLYEYSDYNTVFDEFIEGDVDEDLLDEYDGEVDELEEREELDDLFYDEIGAGFNHLEPLPDTARFLSYNRGYSPPEDDNHEDGPSSLDLFFALEHPFGSAYRDVLNDLIDQLYLFYATEEAAQEDFNANDMTGEWYRRPSLTIRDVNTNPDLSMLSPDGHGASQLEASRGHDHLNPSQAHPSDTSMGDDGYPPYDFYEYDQEEDHYICGRQEGDLTHYDLCLYTPDENCYYCTPIGINLDDDGDDVLPSSSSMQIDQKDFVDVVDHITNNPMTFVPRPSSSTGGDGSEFARLSYMPLYLGDPQMDGENSQRNSLPRLTQNRPHAEIIRKYRPTLSTNIRQTQFDYLRSLTIRQNASYHPYFLQYFHDITSTPAAVRDIVQAGSEPHQIDGAGGVADDADHATTTPPGSKILPAEIPPNAGIAEWRDDTEMIPQALRNQQQFHQRHRRRAARAMVSSSSPSDDPNNSKQHIANSLAAIPLGEDAVGLLEAQDTARYDEYGKFFPQPFSYGVDVDTFLGNQNPLSFITPDFYSDVVKLNLMDQVHDVYGEYSPDSQDYIDTLHYRYDYGFPAPEPDPVVPGPDTPRYWPVGSENDPELQELFNDDTSVFFVHSDDKSGVEKSMHRFYDPLYNYDTHTVVSGNPVIKRTEISEVMVMNTWFAERVKSFERPQEMGHGVYKTLYQDPPRQVEFATTDDDYHQSMLPILRQTSEVQYKRLKGRLDKLVYDRDVYLANQYHDKHIDLSAAKDEVQAQRFKDEVRGFLKNALEKDRAAFAESVTPFDLHILKYFPTTDHLARFAFHAEHLLAHETDPNKLQFHGDYLLNLSGNFGFQRVWYNRNRIEAPEHLGMYLTGSAMLLHLLRPVRRFVQRFFTIQHVNRFNPIPYITAPFVNLSMTRGAINYLGFTTTAGMFGGLTDDFYLKSVAAMTIPTTLLAAIGNRAFASLLFQMGFKNRSFLRTTPIYGLSGAMAGMMYVSAQLDPLHESTIAIPSLFPDTSIPVHLGSLVPKMMMLDALGLGLNAIGVNTRVPHMLHLAGYLCGHLYFQYHQQLYNRLFKPYTHELLFDWMERIHEVTDEDVKKVSERNMDELKMVNRGFEVERDYDDYGRIISSRFTPAVKIKDPALRRKALTTRYFQQRGMDSFIYTIPSISRHPEGFDKQELASILEEYDEMSITPHLDDTLRLLRQEIAKGLAEDNAQLASEILSGNHDNYLAYSYDLASITRDRVFHIDEQGLKDEIELKYKNIAPIIHSIESRSYKH